MTLLQTITERTFYIPGSNNLGIVMTGGGGAVAIDTGLDKETGRMIRKALAEAKLELCAIISTHHHADHIGGNDYLVRNIPGVLVYAPPIEAALIEHPILEPTYLHMGAYPPTTLQTRWLMAKGTPVNRLIEGDQLDIDDVTFEVLRLPGHSINQIGVAIDGVCFVADGFFGPAVLQKHGVPYAHDIGAQLESLSRIAQRRDRYFLPGHGDLTECAALEEILASNQAAVEHANELVQAALAQPGDLSTVADRVRRALGLSFAGIPQYAIFASAIAAHLSYLEASGRACVDLEESGPVWRSSS